MWQFEEHGQVASVKHTKEVESKNTSLAEA
jgi:hypothetical protein